MENTPCAHRRDARLARKPNWSRQEVRVRGWGSWRAKGRSSWGHTEVSYQAGEVNSLGILNMSSLFWLPYVITLLNFGI